MAEASTFAAPAAPATNVETTLNSNLSDDHSSGSNTSVGDLLYTYEDEVKRPYMADYLGVSDIWDKEPTLKGELQTLESHLRKMVTSKKIDNSIRAAKQYLEQMEKDAQIESFESPTRRIAKLLKYVEFRKVIDG